jgi:1-acyl-sn-glycerol-3-phosphate acyltransferase
VQNLLGHLIVIITAIINITRIVRSKVVCILLSVMSQCVLYCCRYVKLCINQVRRLFDLDIELRGMEHLEGDEPLVVIANHQTSVDLFGTILCIYLPFCQIIITFFSLRNACLLR